MKKQLKLIVYDINDILENTLLYADSNSICTNSSVIESMGQCPDSSMQVNSGDTGDIESPCVSNAAGECYYLIACALFVFAR